MQYQTMPFGWNMPLYLPLPPTIDDRDLFINSVVNGGAGAIGPTGPQGVAGVGIATAEVTPNPGDLILLLTDGTVVNAGSVLGPTGSTGSIGPTGPPGPRSPDQPCSCNTTTITEDYCATETDCYIGAQLKGPATVTLPSKVDPGTQYTIKLEFGAPVGNRKLTIEPEAPALINGVSAITMTTPYESVSVIYNNSNWWTI
jgi:hypothetical protein